VEARRTRLFLAFKQMSASGNMSLSAAGEWVPAGSQFKGGKRGLKAKTLRRMLKKAGLKCSGKKATLRARAKKAHLVRGGAEGLGVVSASAQGAPATGGRRRRRPCKKHSTSSSESSSN
jgi:hypothetical protein